MSRRSKVIEKPLSYNVLLVEDDPKGLEVYSDLIHRVAQCNIDIMPRVPEFSDWIGRSNYHLVIIADSKVGIELLEQIKKVNPATSVILISSEATVEQAVSAIRLGAEDYLSKPFNVDSFQLAVKRGLERNIEHYLGVQQLVYVDDATGLYNTRYLNYILEREITHSQISKKSFAVLFIDADKFKGINDEYGHLIGTKLLNELGNHLKKYVREKDTVFRYGGDEFVAVLTACDLDTAKTVAERIRESVEKKLFLKHENLNIHFTISIGVALFPDHAKTKRDIIGAADYAMYTAKKTTRNGVSIASAKPDSFENSDEKEAADGRR
jgi:diguanylate cyclase (GGDEF)-like protein